MCCSLSRWERVGVRGKRFPNDGKHRIGLFENLVIPETQSANALFGEKFIAELVMRLLLIFSVAAAVELNREVSFLAEEVQDVRGNRMLAAEFEATETTGAELLPEKNFGLGRMLAQLAGEGFALTPTLSRKRESEFIVLLPHCFL